MGIFTFYCSQVTLVTGLPSQTSYLSKKGPRERMEPVKFYSTAVLNAPSGPAPPPTLLSMLLQSHGSQRPTYQVYFLIVIMCYYKFEMILLRNVYFKGIMPSLK